MIQRGQMLIILAQPAAAEPPPVEGPDHDEADLLQPDKNEEDTQ